MGQRNRCVIEECERFVYLRSWCSSHYCRWQRYGDPTAGGAPRPRYPNTFRYIQGDDEARFWLRVDRRAENECWPWIGWIEKSGYGRFVLAGSLVQAHRYAHELLIGPIPDGMQIDHVRTRGCVLRSCVNPAHLEAVTPRENTLRGDTPAAANAVKTHCKAGHEFTPENTKLVKRGRACRTCVRRWQREWVQRQKDRVRPGA